MLLPRMVEHEDEPLHLDGWQGHPASLYRLLAFLCDREIANVCFLSGDAHLGCDVDISIGGIGVVGLAGFGLREWTRAVRGSAG